LEATAGTETAVFESRFERSLYDVVESINAWIGFISPVGPACVINHHQSAPFSRASKRPCC
jgi:hypothetical protein